MVFPTVESSDPYIHFDRDQSGRMVGLRQRREGDVMPPTGESDAGLFGLSRRTYLELLPEFAAAAPRGAGTGERNFLPFVPWLSARHPGAISTFGCRDPREAIGINTPEDLRRMEAWLRERHGRMSRGTCA